MTGLSSGDRVVCRYGGVPQEGTYITERDGKAVIKLDTGYNIGVSHTECDLLEKWSPAVPPEVAISQDETLPLLSILSTGGTIASRIDYRTGAVTSQFDAADILRAIPGLSTIARYRTHKLYTILSENMTPGIWQELARAVYNEIDAGAMGVIVTHGTDTMAYSAAAVSFMVESPVPVVFVGSQRSADRPSSDNVMNALCSASAATSPLGEVAVVMHDSTSDDRCAIHRGTRVRKMHTSRRDAFRSIGIPPLGYVEYPSLDVKLSGHAVTRGGKEPGLCDSLEEKCGLVYFHPGMDAGILECYRGYRGLAIAGTGLGHVNTGLIEGIKSLIDEGCVVVMTSQCLHGRVCDRVYDTGRDLLRAGVVEGGDMLPEVALVKLMWVLGNLPDREKATAMMEMNLAGEINRRSLHGL
ncbi:MAG: Glu-tRNA(Gln) amidotransferase subunit GatD [Methanoregulaceae archaeon]|jgi:glutamyl-tRNA(Gln) amidotransferase subunit D|nr:Glu-tRNA(Gln) amidotransferase subunit GatD [Methanoregulaceae archaeon]MDD5684911.1 Glu-tRNA(Gln) amidotransferase subunit GatD [Methanoregulaceae archaeon]